VLIVIQTIARALNLLPSSSTNAPIIVRLSGHAQTNDRLAIREMGRQIAEAEGKLVFDDEDVDIDATQDDVSIVLWLRLILTLHRNTPQRHCRLTS